MTHEPAHLPAQPVFVNGTYHDGWKSGLTDDTDMRLFYPLVHALISVHGWTDYALGLIDGYESLVSRDRA